MRGVNDGVAHSEAHATAIAGRRYHVNLNPVNRVEGTPNEPPSQETLDAFRRTLVERGCLAHVRARRGSDADAACGQLRRRALRRDGPA